MATANVLGPKSKALDEECEQMFDDLSLNAWDGVVEVIEGSQTEEVPEEQEGKSEDVV